MPIDQIKTSARTAYRLRSYVTRGRRTAAQEQAYQTCWPQFGLQVKDGLMDDTKIFGRQAPCYLEIGFGDGQSFLALAKSQPEYNFIGVETHQPGIGAVLMGVRDHQLSNVRIYYHDVMDVLEQSIQDASLAGIQIFFPDPWPKRRHRLRRLIQPEFVQLAAAKIQNGGILHLATDWEDYAEHMMAVVSQEPTLKNLINPGQFAHRSSQRPIVTKFENRALREGRKIWELQMQRV